MHFYACSHIHIFESSNKNTGLWNKSLAHFVLKIAMDFQVDFEMKLFSFPQNL